MSTAFFAVVRACSIALLRGATLQAEDVSAGHGEVVDWRTVRSGVTVREGLDAFDAALTFVRMVGTDAALLAATRDGNIPDAPPFVDPPPRITTFAPDEHGQRRRQFEVGTLRVVVEPLDWLDSDDWRAAEFTELLAVAAARLVPGEKADV